MSIADFVKNAKEDLGKIVEKIELKRGEDGTWRLVIVPVRGPKQINLSFGLSDKEVIDAG